MVVWADGLTTKPRYRIYDDGWGPELAAPATGGRLPEMLRVSADPGSQRLAMVAISTGGGGGSNWRELYGYLWNGSSWGAPTLFATKVGSILGGQVKEQAVMAFESRSGLLHVVYGHNNHRRPSHRVFDGVSWSDETMLGDMGGSPNTLGIVSDPRSNQLQLSYVDESTGAAGRYFWDGASFAGAVRFSPPAFRHPAINPSSRPTIRTSRTSLPAW